MMAMALVMAAPLFTNRDPSRKAVKLFAPGRRRRRAVEVPEARGGLLVVDDEPFLREAAARVVTRPASGGSGR
jgi:hypothetical protein